MIRQVFSCCGGGGGGSSGSCSPGWPSACIYMSHWLRHCWIICWISFFQAQGIELNGTLKKSVVSVEEKKKSPGHWGGKEDHYIDHTRGRWASSYTERDPATIAQQGVILFFSCSALCPLFSLVVYAECVFSLLLLLIHLPTGSSPLNMFWL